jgi:hypothetical protein
MKGSQMTRIREIQPVEWETFLREFNARNYARPVRLETIARGYGLAARGWTPVLAVHQPLMGVELDPRGSEAKSITVALGGLEAGMPQFTHVVGRPTRLWIEEPPRGLTRRLTIESADESGTSVVFEPAAAPLRGGEPLPGNEAAELIEDLEAIGIGS